MRHFLFTLVFLSVFASVSCRADNAPLIMPDYFIGYWAPLITYRHDLGYDIKADGTMNVVMNLERQEKVKFIEYRLLKAEEGRVELLVRSVFTPEILGDTADYDGRDAPYYRIWVMERDPSEEDYSYIYIASKDMPESLTRNPALWTYSYEDLMKIYKDSSYEYAGILRRKYYKDDINTPLQP